MKVVSETPSLLFFSFIPLLSLFFFFVTFFFTRLNSLWVGFPSLSLGQINWVNPLPLLSLFLFLQSPSLALAHTVSRRIYSTVLIDGNSGGSTMDDPWWHGGCRLMTWSSVRVSARIMLGVSCCSWGVSVRFRRTGKLWRCGLEAIVVWWGPSGCVARGIWWG